MPNGRVFQNPPFYTTPSEVQFCRTGDSNENRLLIDQQLIPFSYR